MPQWEIKDMKSFRVGVFFSVLILIALIFLCTSPGLAAVTSDHPLSGKNYVLPEESNYDYEGATPVQKFFYGHDAMGTVNLRGKIAKESVYKGVDAYGATGPLTVRYDYNGKLQEKDADFWHIDDDGTRWLRGYDMGFLQNIGKGCIMIEKSSDAVHWEKAIDPIKNYFDKARTLGECQILSIPQAEYRNGMYYRVVAAYTFEKRTKDGFLNFDEYDRRKCVELPV